MIILSSPAILSPLRFSPPPFMRRRPSLFDWQAPDAGRQFYEYLYLRDNPAGEHRELWYHSAGCHAWLVVTRDTRNHAITAVEVAKARKAGVTA